MLTGGRLTVEDAYAYSKFARMALRTNDIDFRARPLSAEEADFLASSVVGSRVTYADVEAAPAVVLAGLEPEEECPILFLRLRKAYRKGTLTVYAVAPYRYPRPGEAGRDRWCGRCRVRRRRCSPRTPTLAEALARPGAVLIVGERLATVPGCAVGGGGARRADRREAGVGAAAGR